MQHWLVKEYAKLVGNHLQIWSGSFTGRGGGGGSWPSEATASGFEKKTGPNGEGRGQRGAWAKTLPQR